MEESTLSLIVAALALIIAIIAILQTKKQNPEPASKEGFSSMPLQLQAYERLALFCERISIPNIVSRTNDPMLAAKQMQVVLIEHIKQEFEYNASQQIYVSPIAWESVRHLKDQTMLLINQVASTLPAEAKARDLNRQLMDLVSQQEKPLHIIVLDSVNFEARKIMN